MNDLHIIASINCISHALSKSMYLASCCPLTMSICPAQLLPDNLFAENWTASGTDLSFPQHELQDLADRGG
jgi:hypothetical protein